MSFLMFQKALLGVLLVLATVVVSCHAQCYRIAMEGGEDDSPGECKDLNGAIHSMHSKWETSDCEECSCNEHGIQCCSTVSRPVLYDKIKCRSYFHKDNCTYTVVERKNPGKPCEVHGWIL